MKNRLRRVALYLAMVGFYSIVVSAVFAYANSSSIPRYSLVTLLIGALLAWLFPLNFDERREQAAEGSLTALHTANIGTDNHQIASLDSGSNGGGDSGD